MSAPLVDQLAEALIAITPSGPESVERLRAIYDADVVFRDPIQTIHGLEGFLEMNRRLLNRMRSLRFDVTLRAGDDRTVFLEWTMVGATKLGPSLDVAGVTRARTRDGKVIDHRDYWDVGELFASAVPGGDAILRTLRRPFA